ncbi:Ras protein-specific guanine nucleotide-releasing factor [Saguinus oedipus]|uniref:Ras protein-specific guanine nucleotide-releasing factor n=1 Tax=Saguinus oedipus TaxID=9490 RepID=A0ABQ9VF75_SAGOE|nr:Ras protein-specific guanine nucleotide-releasing factor [Saguinus oedipus]
MYLTDLAFIEEGTPNYTEDGLVNFSKMRMISHIIREIRQFQQTAYKIEHQAKVSGAFSWSLMRFHSGSV